MTSTVSGRYEALASSGAIERDPAQLAAVKRLDALVTSLPGQVEARKSGSLGWLFAKKNAARPRVKGLYIWGDVGRGKTMLMDLFFAALPVAKKRRVHFHAFMSETHERVHDFRQRLRRGEIKGDDPMPPVASAIAAETRVLCFDEFAVTDIADAMILGRLFTQLFERGVVVVATSNVAPVDLYRDGLQRQNFLPFIKLLQERVDVVHLVARTDFRLEKLENLPVWHTPLGAGADTAMDETWAHIAGGADAPDVLIVKGRTLPVPHAAIGAARFTFAELCGRPLGAADYLALARRFHTLVIDRVPVMDFAQRNEARRFITLIDALYDHGTKLIASADAEPARLYVGDEGKEAFEFRRTASRLVEMRSKDYLAAPHLVRGETSFVPIET
jgi:cell division protein ZapE